VRVLQGRVIHPGRAEGRALVSNEPISFLGEIEPETGLVVAPCHPLSGCDLTGRVLVFPTGKGSTVGSYVLYRLRHSGHAPAALVNARCEAIVAVGAIIADIPTVDQIDITEIASGDWVRIEEGGRIFVGA
jgi:predicted aconitase with swiveling domain